MTLYIQHIGFRWYVFASPETSYMPLLSVGARKFLTLLGALWYCAGKKQKPTFLPSYSWEEYYAHVAIEMRYRNRHIEIE